MTKHGLILIGLMALTGVASATPMDAKTADGFRKGATASCIKSLSSQGKRFTATQIKSYCGCHASYLSRALSLEDVQRGQIGPQDPRIIAASKACINRLGPIKK